jgi:uncharacterized protein involved in exopolysaccharide biosynthesis
MNRAQQIRSEVTPRDIVRAIFRHRKKAVTFFVLVVSGAVIWTLLSKNVYRSEAKLLVRLGRENVSLDPTASVGGKAFVTITEARETEINSVVEVLCSRTLAEHVVEQVGADFVLAESAGDHRATLEGDTAGVASWAGQSADLLNGLRERLYEVLVDAGISANLSERDMAIQKLMQHLTVEAVPKSNVICVSYEGPAPDMSQAIVSATVGAYLDQHMHLNRTGGAHEFLKEQTERCRQELAEAEDQLQALQNETGFVSPQEQRVMLVERMGALEGECSRITAEIAHVREKLKGLRSHLSTTPKTQVAATLTGAGNEGTDNIRGQLYALEIRYQELAAKLTDNHPQLVEIRRELAEAREIHSLEDSTRVEETTAPNPAYTQTELALLSDEPRLAALQSESEVLQKELAEIQERLHALNDVEKQIVRLRRAIELKESNYREYVASLEQARIDEALEYERISNINIAQPATLDMKPVRPQRKLSLLLGLMAGFCGALGLALVAEYADRSVKTPEQIEAHIEVPVLASIPYLSRRELAINGKHR